MLQEQLISIGEETVSEHVRYVPQAARTEALQPAGVVLRPGSHTDTNSSRRHLNISAGYTSILFHFCYRSGIVVPA